MLLAKAEYGIEHLAVAVVVEYGDGIGVAEPDAEATPVWVVAHRRA